MDVVYKVPKLVKLSENPGTERTYTLERGYRYVDLLVVGGGGGGGYNSGGGGGSGTMLYVRNLIVSKLKNTTIRYNIAGESGLQEDGKNTVVVIDGFSVNVPGGKRGISHGGEGGDGGSLLPQSSIDALLKYVDDNDNDIAVCSNGGGSGGYWNANEHISHAGCSGASTSQMGQNVSSSTAGKGVINDDGIGGYWGGSGYIYEGGRGYRRNNTIIPLRSVFQGGGESGAGGNRDVGVSSGSGGGAAGYQSGGNGGATTGSHGQNGGIGAGGGGGGGNNAPGSKGGQGIICLYYH